MISGRRPRSRHSKAETSGSRLSPVFLRNLIVFFAALHLGGCAQLPEYALPQFYASEGPMLPAIPYRQLKREDFQAASLPAGMQTHAGSLHARSNLQIRPGRDVKILIESNWYHGQVVFVGRVENLSFEAVLVPEKSWWNPDMAKDKEAYVLEHEQVHFGLLELTARSLTEQAAAIGKDIFVIDSSYAGARDGVLQRIGEMIQSRTEELYEEHKRFDEETSLFIDPVSQRRWYDRLQDQLGQ